MTINILLVDDSDNDALIFKRALNGTKLKILDHVKDGAEALAFLKKQAPFENKKSPTIVLMDIHMPFLNGIDALISIKSDPDIKHIPVIMLTTSADKDDVVRAYNNYASGFMVKPVDPQEILKIIDALNVYWSNQKIVEATEHE